MWGKTGAVATIVLMALCMVASPARAIVVEDVMAQHPLVAFWSNWSLSAGNIDSPALRDMPSSLSTDASAMPAQVERTDNMTVEIVPLRLPELPSYVAFAIYLIGALVFYTLLVLVAQPGPAEYY
ncbi:MAG: hypothetical protein HPY54_16180 [Chthonomonadetes bacterium]|nr:hypothetical protein [Chthonomonadetes bacterium]